MAERQPEPYHYETERALLLQYFDTAPGFPEEFLVHLYQQCKRDRILPWLFPSDPKITLPAFVHRLHGKYPVVGMVKAPYNVAVSERHALGPVAGFGWLEERQGPPGAVKASLAFTFFRSYWGRPEIRAISRLALKFWFEGCGVDMLYGTTLAHNGRAKRFAQELGLEEIAVLPNFISRGGGLADAALLGLSKVRFSELEADEWQPIEFSAVPTIASTI